MNTFKGTIININTEESINLLDIDVNGTMITSVTLQLSPEFKSGKQVTLMFKESEIILTDAINKFIGIENYIPVRIKNITKGKIFNEIELDSDAGDFRALVTNISIGEKTIILGDSYFALIKANEISIGGEI